MVHAEIFDYQPPTWSSTTYTKVRRLVVVKHAKCKWRGNRRKHGPGYNLRVAQVSRYYSAFLDDPNVWK
jgi:hypothetical protein